MDAAIDHSQKLVPAAAGGLEWQYTYKPLPCLYLVLLTVWISLLSIWALNTWMRRHWQTSNLQWTLTVVPVLKALVLGLSLIFWYSCLNLNTCSFWVAFGVFVMQIFFETSCFIAFLLISHGYSIMYEQLSISERRNIAGLSSLLYLALTGYKASVPQFAVLLVIVYFVIVYVIFLHITKNLNALQNQLQYIQEDDMQLMHSAVHTKYNMFKNFQGTMLLIIVAEILAHSRVDGGANEHWIRLLIRECVEIGIFFYIGWIFRSRAVTPFFTVIPNLHSPDHRILPPIYSIEMDQAEFDNLDFKDWHIGLPTPVSKEDDDQKPMLVIVCNPGLCTHEDNSGRSTSKKQISTSTARRSFTLTPCRQPTLQTNYGVSNRVAMDMRPSPCSISSFWRRYPADKEKEHSHVMHEIEGICPVSNKYRVISSITHDSVKHDGTH